MRSIASRLLLASAFAAPCVLCASPAVASCAAPPRDATRAADWDDVRLLAADKSENAQISFVQTLDGTGAGDVNLDYYAITVDRTGTAKQMFADFRRRMGEMLFRKGSLAQGFYSFRGYDQANQQRWDAVDPRGALMTFVLFRGAGIEFERGSVVVSCSDDTSFVFSTVNTAADGDHPVSGNRSFGIVDNKDGSVTFFTKAADRVKGSSYFDLLGGAQRQATFAAGAQIWEHLLDNVQSAYPTAHPRKRVARSLRQPYVPPAGTGAANLPAPAAPSGALDAAAFRNGVREFADTRALSGGALTPAAVTQVARQAKAAVSDANAETRAAYGYALGLTYASSYQRRLDDLMRQHAAELGAPALDNVTLATADLVGDATLEAGATYRSAMAQLPPIPGLPTSDPGEAFRNALTQLPALSFNADTIRDQATAAFKAAAYDLVNQQIESIRTQVEQQATAAAINFLTDNVDVDQSQLAAMASMRQYMSAKGALKLLEMRNLGELSDVIFKILVISGQCTQQPLCVAYVTVTRVQKLKDANDLASWAGEIALDQVAPGAADFIKTIKTYADKVRLLADIYEKIQAARQVVEAADAAKSAIADLGQVDLAHSLNDAFNEQVDGLRNGGGELCGVVASGAAEPASCKLLSDGRLLEDASQRLANALATMDRQLETVTGVHAILQPLVTTAQALATVSAVEVRPRIERFYAAAEVLRRKVTTTRVDLARTVAGPILGAAGLSAEEAEQRAYLLASLEEQARDAAQADVDAIATAGAEVQAPASEVTASANAAAATATPVRPTGLPVSLTSLTMQLTSLYAAQGQTTDTIRSRFQESKSAFLFFRQFPPFFYSRALVHLASQPELAGLRQSVEGYRGWVVGDPHLQNFGSFIPLNVDTITQMDISPPAFRPLSPKDDCNTKRDGQAARYVMNDLDDGGEGSMMLDLTRYLVGLELYSTDTPADQIAKLVDAYVKAVEGTPQGASEVTSDLLNGANPKVGREGGVCTIRGGMMPGTKYVSTDMTRFSAYRSDADLHQPLSTAEAGQATDIARALIGSEATILDSYKYQRFRGGSGGNWRWELLVRPGPPRTRDGHSADPIPYWIELKGLALIPGSYPASSVNFAALNPAQLAAAAKNRYRSLIDMTQEGDDAFGAYRLVDTSDGPALARFRFAGQDSVSLEGLSASDLVDLAYDQLTALGTIHRRSLTRAMGSKAPTDYAAAVRRDRQALVALVAGLVADLSASYAALPTTTASPD